MFLKAAIFLSLSSQAWAAGFQNEISCYKGLLGYTAGSDLSLSGSMIALPANQDGHRGLYVYTERTAYFCQLPDKPSASDAQMSQYNMLLSFPGKPKTYALYTELKGDLANPKLTVSKGPGGQVFADASCKDSLTPDTRKALTNELTARIQGTHKNFKDYQEEVDSEAGPGRADAAPFVAALDQCSKNPDLTQAANSEIVKFGGTAPAQITPAKLDSPAGAGH